MIGVIRVFTTEDPKILHQHGAIITEKYGLETINRCIPNQLLGIYNDETEQIAIPKIVDLGKKLVNEGCQLLVVSCAADPAVEQLRNTVNVPVIGAGSSAALTALSLGEPVGVMGIGDEIPNVMKSILGDFYVGYARPEGVTNTTDLLTPAGKEKSLQTARSLMEQGAKVIVFACTGYSTIRLADVLRKELQITVIDAVEAEGLFASYVMQQRK